MRLAGKPVVFRLSPEGQHALKDVFPVGGSFTAHVVEEDELGLWISTVEEANSESSQPTPVILLKWQYFSTAVVDSEPQRPRSRVRAGFR